ncbi:MAG: terminase gpA endonuclease subunit [Planctomycetaceae bacterium]
MSNRKKKPSLSNSEKLSSLRDLARKAKSLEELDAIESQINRLLQLDQAEPEDGYERKKRREAARQREKSAKHRDIADTCPPCKCTKTRQKILKSLRFALETLFPDKFKLAWGQDHLDLLKDLQRAILQGDQLARAMPRGTGKTSILLGAIIWAILTGKHKFVVLIAATGQASKELLEQITTLFETNEQLYAYFPELIHPIRQLEGIRQRRLLWEGERIRQEWTKDRIVLPNVPGAHGAGVVIKAAGLLGRIRGMNFQRYDGESLRPTLALIDDPQTDMSAKRDKENDSREKTLCETVAGLAGPGQKISILVACTVIKPDDLADRILSRDKHPEFHGVRTKLLRSEPTNKDLWNQYGEILRECLRAGGDDGIKRATDFYKANQKAMDEGADPSWPARYNDDEASAVQFAMNIKILKPAMFAAEYQNSPLVLVELETTLDADKLTRKLSGYNAYQIPLPTEYITAGIDVQKHYLVYALAAWEQNSTGYIIGYGTWPDQKLQYYDRRSATRTIATEFPGLDEKAQLWKALEALCVLLFGREYIRQDDNARMSLRRACIDVRYNGETVKRFAKASPHKEALLPAQGIYIAAGQTLINERAAKPGEISRYDYRLPPLENGQIARTASFDSAEYIGKVHDAFSLAPGTKGALSLFNAESHLHRCYCDQICAEYPTWMEAKGRKKRMWALKPGGPDNDYLDATKLAMLAGYTLGMEPSYVPPKPKKTTTQRSEPRYSVI